MDPLKMSKGGKVIAMGKEEPCNKTYAEMQDGEIVPVYEYHYTGTVNLWTNKGIEQRPAPEMSQDEASTLKTLHSGIEV
jgi:hypothetical protein